VGVSEPYLMQQRNAPSAPTGPKQIEMQRTLKRFYATLVLNDLIQEKSVEDVAERFKLDKQAVQNLQVTASCTSMLHFARRCTCRASCGHDHHTELTHNPI
jgi:hypothetical protein